MANLQMRVVSTVPTEHEDIIHDTAYDFYGKRMATCSSDQKIKVWDLDDSGNWTLTSQWKAHTGSVWKVAWAHPEFGQVIASCSFDRTVFIWEEQSTEHSSKAKCSTTEWVRKASLVDSKDSVRDIEFAPKHLGLKLATCSADGFIRIYEANDVMNLALWPLMEEFESRKGGCNCISWNPSRFHPQMIAVGSDDSEVKIWEYNDASRKWIKIESLIGHNDAVHDVAFAPNVGRTYHLLATCSKDRTVRIWTLTPRQAPDATQAPAQSGSLLDVQQVAVFEDHDAEVWRVEWNITGTILASSGDDGMVRLWKLTYLDTWKCIAAIRGDEEAAE